MVNLPPSGMASRALIARLTRALAVPQAGAGDGLDIDVFLQGVAQQAGDAGDQIVGVDDLRVQHLLAREGQKVLGQLRSALGRVDHGGELRVVLAELVFEQLGVAQGHRQRVVEVVRHPGRELAHGLHLLGLAELFLGPLMLGDVPREAADDLAATEVNVECRDLDRNLAAVFGYVDGLKSAGLTALETGPGARPIGLRHIGIDVPDMHFGQFAPRIAEQAKTKLVNVFEAAILSEQDYGFTRVIDTELGEQERLLRPLTFRDTLEQVPV
jgi:hypothetical protein